MSPERTKTHAPNTCFPRVSGDEPHTMREMTNELLFSPRERG